MLPVTFSEPSTRASDLTQLRAIRALPLASKAIPAIHGSALPSLGSAWTSGPEVGSVMLVWPAVSGS